MAEESGVAIIAAVNTTAPAGVSPRPDLAAIPASNIQIKFRQALGELPNAEHAYIDITRANGTHQVIGAYPVGGTYQTHEGGQLFFEAGQEKEHPRTTAEFELKAPQGMSLTQYANALVDGAKAYNTHPVRYDGIGEDGFNSNSFVSSLIVAKGGRTGLTDVERIASIVDTSPIRTFGRPSTMNDAQMTDLVRRDYDSDRLVASGFGHAAIEPRRFTFDARLAEATPPPEPQLTNVRAALPALGSELSRLVSKAIGDRDATPSAHAATNPYVPGGTVRVRYAGEDRDVGPGYRQSGVITSVRDGIVTQSTGRSTAEYKLSDLTAGARDVKAMENMLLPGRIVQISVDQERVHVASLERNRDLDRIQEHGRGR